MASEPQTYDDCILENMDGVRSDRAAHYVHRSCKEKFPESPDAPNDSRSLTREEIVALTGKAGLSYGNRFGGSLYNGNSNITITDLTIIVGAQFGGEPEYRGYDLNVTIPPRTTKDFGVDIVRGDKDADYSWDVAEARGYEN